LFSDSSPLACGFRGGFRKLVSLNEILIVIPDDENTTWNPISCYVLRWYYGSKPCDIHPGPEKNLRASGEYFRWSADHSKVKGSPYLTEEFRPGMIHWNRMWNEGIDLRYNIYQGSFEAKLKSGTIVIDPIKNNIDTIKYREEVFVKQYE